MDTYLIYQITNKVNSKSYIGQTKNWKRRWSEHCNPYKDYAISNAIRKYGKEQFEVRFLVDGLSLEHSNNLEILFIDLEGTIRPNGYNISDGGSKGNTFVGLTDAQMEEFRRKQRKSKKGKRLSMEHRKKMSESRKGKPRSSELKRKMSELKKGVNNPMKRPEIAAKITGDNHYKKSNWKSKSHIEIEKVLLDNKSLSVSDISKMTGITLRQVHYMLASDKIEGLNKIKRGLYQIVK